MSGGQVRARPSPFHHLLTPLNLPSTRTYLIIVRVMRCGQNGMAARREVQSIRGLLTSRATQRTPVRPRRAEQGSLWDVTPERDAAHQLKRVLVRTCTVASPKDMGPLLHAAVRAATRRDGTSFRARRCCSLLVWTGQTSSLAPSRSSKIASIAHVNDYEIGSRVW